MIEALSLAFSIILSLCHAPITIGFLKLFGSLMLHSMSEGGNPTLGSWGGQTHGTKPWTDEVSSSLLVTTTHSTKDEGPMGVTLGTELTPRYWEAAFVVPRGQCSLGSHRRR